MSDFNRAFAVVVEAEGGYVNDPRDPGGATRYGITEAVARANGYTGDMRHLPLDTARAIYRRDYWDACKCSDMPWPLSLYVFDAAVNQGTLPAVTMLQRALDTVQDGTAGPVTLRLAKGSKPWHWARFMAFRAMRYQSTRNFDRFGEGWLTRIFTLAQEANHG
ncbi:MAG: hypothetical protein M1449_08070 [Candidatus Thermoplasmatota archaeon]|nr:hypothetical protein [Candidatus Thermoplasmatota archaeon]